MQRDAVWAIRQVVLLLIALFAWTTHAQTDDTSAAPYKPSHYYDIAGRLLPWYITKVQVPWVGGNYYQLDEILSGIEDNFKEATKNLRDLARDKDAAAMHLGDLYDYANKRNAVHLPTSLVVILSNEDFGPSFRKDAHAAWKNFATYFVKPEAPRPAEILLRKPTETIRFGGLRSYSAIFTIKGAPGGDWCRVTTVIPLGKRGTHFFIMTAAQSRCEQRYMEFEDMLSRLRYHPNLVREVTDAPQE